MNATRSRQKLSSTNSSAAAAVSPAVSASSKRESHSSTSVVAGSTAVSVISPPASDWTQRIVPPRLSAWWSPFDSSPACASARGATAWRSSCPTARVVSDLLAAMDVAPRSCVVAINREYADERAPVRAGDEVALVPPVSGGAGVVRIGAGDGRAARPGGARRGGARPGGGRGRAVRGRHARGPRARLRGLRRDGRAEAARDRRGGRGGLRAAARSRSSTARARCRWASRA